MERKLVRILGIEHHYLYDDIIRGNLGGKVLSSSSKQSSLIEHRNELALYIPGFSYDVGDVDLQKPGRISLQSDSSGVGFRFPQTSPDDVCLIQLDPDRVQNGQSPYDTPLYNIILAREGEFEEVRADSLPESIRSTSNLTPFEEAAIYLSEYCINPDFQFNVLSYRREPFTQKEISVHEKLLPQPYRQDLSRDMLLEERIK